MEVLAMRRFCLTWLVCLVCLAPVRAQSLDKDAKAQTILFVQKLQTKEGGFLAAPLDSTSNQIQKPTLRATSAGVRALKYLGAEVPDKPACIKFVAGCFDKATGGFADQPGGKADVFTTSVGLMAVVALGMPAEPYHAAGIKFLADNTKAFEEIRIAVAGLEAIKAESPRKEEWTAEVMKFKVPAMMEGDDTGRARLLASKVVTLLRLGHAIDKEKLPAILEGLRTGQRFNGGYGKDDSLKTDLESTYRVMRAFMMLQQKPASVEHMVSYIAKCRNGDNGYGVSPGAPSSVSGVYYAAIILHWLEEMK
jgi:prenyltransferase beta subunit